MRKITLFVILVLTSFFANGQDTAFKEDVQKLMKAVGLPERIEARKEYEAMWVTPDKEKAHMEKVEASIPIFLQNAEDYYMKRYTHEEVKELLKFYDSPLGKKVTGNTLKLIAAHSAVEDIWSETFREIFFKYKKPRDK